MRKYQIKLSDWIAYGSKSSYLEHHFELRLSTLITAPNKKRQK